MNSISPEIFTYVVLPLLIFLARICDVTIGTLRIIFLSKGNKFIVPILGFFEVLIWIFAISRIMQNLSNVFCYIGYAGGFATGNYIGMYIEERLAIGIAIVRIITKKPNEELTKKLNSCGFGVTVIDAQGSREEVNVIFTIVKRSDINSVVEIIKEVNPSAFYSIEDVKCVNQGVFPSNTQSSSLKLNLFRRWRRGI